MTCETALRSAGFGLLAGESGFVEGDGGDVPGFGGVGLHFAGDGFDKAFDELFTGAATGTGAGGFSDRGDGGFSGFDGFDDFAFADAVTIANLLVVVLAYRRRRSRSLSQRESRRGDRRGVWGVPCRT